MRGGSTIRPAAASTALVLAELRKAISQGDLAPGEQIRQQLWADRIGVSRPPLREALEILTAEGLVLHGLHQGYFVTKFSRDEMQQLYTMRLLLEQEALKAIEWPDDEQLATLDDKADKIEEHARAGRPDIAMQELAEFYLAVYGLSSRKLIVDEIQRLWIKTTAYRSLSLDIMRDPTRPSHRLHLIVDLVRQRNLERLREVLLRPTLRGQMGMSVTIPEPSLDDYEGTAAG